MKKRNNWTMDTMGTEEASAQWGVLSLKDTIMSQFFDNAYEMSTPAGEERVIKTIWAHLYDLQRMQPAEGPGRYIRMATDFRRLSPEAHAAFTRAFRNHVEDGVLPLSTEINYYGELLVKTYTNWYAQVETLRNFSRPMTDRVYMGDWETRLHEKGWRQCTQDSRVLMRNRNFRYINRYLTERMTHETPLKLFPGNEPELDRAFYMLMVPRGGSTLGNRGWFDCKITLLAVKSFEVEVNESMTPYPREYESAETRYTTPYTSVTGYPVAIDPASERAYIDRTLELNFIYLTNRAPSFVERMREGSKQQTATRLFGPRGIDRMFNPDDPAWMQWYTYKLSGPIPPPDTRTRAQIISDPEPPQPQPPLHTRIRIDTSCEIPFDAYAFKFTRLEQEEKTFWLYTLLKFQHIWRQKYKPQIQNNPREDTRNWQGTIGPYYKNKPQSTYTVTPNNRNYSDYSTPAQMLITPKNRPHQTTRRQRIPTTHTKHTTKLPISSSIHITTTSMPNSIN